MFYIHKYIRSYKHIYVTMLTYVTGFGKTDHVHTRIEIYFIAYYNSHTQALFRHSDTIEKYRMAQNFDGGKF